MSENYQPVPPTGFAPPAHDEQSDAAAWSDVQAQSGAQGQSDGQGKADAAKQAAGELKDTVAENAGSVAGTATEEAAGVAREAKSQAKDLYHQTQSELKEQAGVQQQRVATGLRSLGDELGSMADGSDSDGLASDLVRQVSDRAGSAASWLDARDPGSLLAEVKSYARRKPGTFIAAAAIAGVLAGRLTRALAAGAADEKAAAASADAHPESASTVAPVAPVVPTSVAPVTAPVTVVDPGYRTDLDETPLYTERASTLDDGFGSQGEGTQR
ncbi:hypothetical protein [Herbiconiux sp. YIM B11900]|uniref:hypothetical protein n=1 Tax=Herbiconiux sp. YIM B11900 TaxID=3404131 RepID=UPI003F86E240